MPGGWIGLRAPSVRLSRVGQSEWEGRVGQREREGRVGLLRLRVRLLGGTLSETAGIGEQLGFGES